MGADQMSSDKLSFTKVNPITTSDILKNFDGSVRYSQGNTDILAFVNGPFEVKSLIVISL